MKSYSKEAWFNIPPRREFINITPNIEQAIRESGILFVRSNDDYSGTIHTKPHLTCMWTLQVNKHQYRKGSTANLS